MKKSWDEEEEKIKKPRKRKIDKANKMKVSGKSVFEIQKKLKKK